SANALAVVPIGAAMREIAEVQIHPEVRQSIEVRIDRLTVAGQCAANEVAVVHEALIDVAHGAAAPVERVADGERPAGRVEQTLDDEVAGNGVIGVQRPSLAGRNCEYVVGTADEQIVLLRNKVGAAVAFDDDVEESAGRRVQG